MSILAEPSASGPAPVDRRAAAPDPADRDPSDRDLAIARTARVASAGLVVVSAVVGIIALMRVGPDATVPVHWGVAGTPDGYGPAWLGLLVIPVTQVGLLALLAALPRFEARRGHLRRSARSYWLIVVAALGLLTLLQAGVALAALGGSLDFTSLVVGGTGILFIVIGLALPGLRSNFVAGIRTPWTLSSERSWQASHRLGGRLFAVAGIAMLVLTPFLDPIALTIALLVGLLGVTLAVVVYSYRVWRDDPDRDER